MKTIKQDQITIKYQNYQDHILIILMKVGPKCVFNFKFESNVFQNVIVNLLQLLQNSFILNLMNLLNLILLFVKFFVATKYERLEDLL